MPLHFVLSSKRKKLLLHDGYLFNRLKQHNVTKVITWRCVEQQNEKYRCNALAKTSSSEKNGRLEFCFNNVTLVLFFFRVIYTFRCLNRIINFRR